MGGYKHTTVADATVRAEYASAGQVQDGAFTSLSTVTGTNTITATAPLGMSSYVTGQRFSFVAAATNTGAVTININSIGAKSITKFGSTALIAGDIINAMVCQVVYDGTQFQLLNANPIPSGVITMWSGSIVSIPSGWFLCNGSNGTPDLRDRFVVGAGSTYSVGGTGGSANAIVVAHTHSITDPGHAHTPDNGGSFIKSGGFGANITGWPAGATFFPTGSDGNTETSTTGISVNSAGSSGTNANLPPYYALAYIMKG